MNLAIQHSLLPGTSLTEKFQHAADYGFSGVELTAWGFDGPMSHYINEIEQAVRASGIPVSSLCTMKSDDFVHPEPQERAKRLDGLVAMLELAETLNARGVIALPIRPPVQIPDLSPVADSHTLITQLIIAMTKSAVERTSSKKAQIFLEPLNRYEAYYLRTVGHAAELCKQIGSSRVQVMADLFHMSIEEANIARALREIKGYVGHVHLADSNRLLPGHGHTDFVAPFRVLKEIGFSGWLSIECSIPGDPTQTLPVAASYLRQRWAEA